jgi:hypothetical protein
VLAGYEKNIRGICETSYQELIIPHTADNEFDMTTFNAKLLLTIAINVFYKISVIF